jgi:lysophospholipase L1-like esterase
VSRPYDVLMRRVGGALIVLLAAAVCAAAGYVIAHNDDVPDAGQTPSLPASITAVAQPSAVPSTPQSSAAGTSTSATTATSRPIVAFLGDDWTKGVGASKKSKRFSTQLSNRLHFVERNFGADGTGYAKSGPSDGPYVSRVKRVVDAHPAVVIVSGGRNDASDYPATAADAAKALFAELHRDLPNAKLIAIAPFWGDSDEPPELVAFAKAVQQAVTAVGGSYVDVPDPIHGHPEYMGNAADPNDKGYAAIAAALQPKLAALLGS